EITWYPRNAASEKTYKEAISTGTLMFPTSCKRPPLSRSRRKTQGGCDSGMNICSFKNYASTFYDLVLAIDLEFPFFNQQPKQAAYVRRVKLAGVNGNRPGQIQRRHNDDPVVINRLPWSGQCAISASGPG